MKKVWWSILALYLLGLGGFSQELGVAWGPDPFGVEINRLRLGTYPLNANICEPLFRLTKDFRVEPWLARGYEYLGNGVFRIYLREGVRFHNGQPLTAEAVKWSLDRTVKLRLGYSQLGDDSIKVVNEYILDIKPARTNMRLIEQLVHTTYAIYWPGSDPGVKPVCTGPYQFVEYVPNNRLVVEANPSYWGRKPRLPRLVFRFFPDDNTRLLALLSGQVDIAVDLPRGAVASLQKNPALNLVTAPPGAVLMVTFNAKGSETHNLLTDIRLRKAVAYAIDRKTLVDQVLEGFALFVTTVNPPAALGAYAPLVKAIPYNPDKAEALLDEAGWKRGSDGIRAKEGRRLTLTLVYTSGELGGIGPELSQYLQDQLKRVGIELKVEPVDPGTSTARQEKGQFDLFMWLPNQNDANPAFLLQLWWSKVATAKAGPWVQAGPEFDRYIDQILTTPDPYELRRLSAEAMRVLIERQTIALPLAGIYRIYGLKKRVKGFNPHPARLYLDWSTLYLAKD